METNVYDMVVSKDWLYYIHQTGPGLCREVKQIPLSSLDNGAIDLPHLDTVTTSMRMSTSASHVGLYIDEKKRVIATVSTDGIESTYLLVDERPIQIKRDCPYFVHVSDEYDQSTLIPFSRKFAVLRDREITLIEQPTTIQEIFEYVLIPSGITRKDYLLFDLWSVVADYCRNRPGHLATYPIGLNMHRNTIIRQTPSCTGLFTVTMFGEGLVLTDLSDNCFRVCYSVPPLPPTVLSKRDLAIDSVNDCVYCIEITGRSSHIIKIALDKRYFIPCSKLF